MKQEHVTELVKNDSGKDLSLENWTEIEREREGCWCQWWAGSGVFPCKECPRIHSGCQTWGNPSHKQEHTPFCRQAHTCPLYLSFSISPLHKHPRTYVHKPKIECGLDSMSVMLQIKQMLLHQLIHNNIFPSIHPFTKLNVNKMIYNFKWQK